MTDTKEKLVELLDEAEEWADHKCDELDCEKCPADKMKGNCVQQLMVDRLIAHGVTVQEWISVKDRLPDLIPCSAGTAYSEAVNVLTSGRKVITAIWDGTDFIGDAEFWEAEDEEITHWTPVLLPLPQPPKDGE